MISDFTFNNCMCLLDGVGTGTWFYIAMGCFAAALLTLIVGVILIVVWGKKDKTPTVVKKKMVDTSFDDEPTVAIRPQPQQVVRQAQQQSSNIPQQPRPMQPMQTQPRPMQPQPQPMQTQPRPMQPQPQPMQPQPRPVQPQPVQPQYNSPQVKDDYEESCSATKVLGEETSDFDEYDATMIATPKTSAASNNDFDEYDATVTVDDMKADFRVTRSIIVMHTEEVIY